MSQVIAEVKSLFLDRAKVVRAVGKGAAQAMKKAGAFIRRRAQTSMPYRTKGSSAPGRPPFAHPSRGAKLRKLLFYSYDPAHQSVVIGPVALPNKSTVGATVANLMEFGGRVVRRGKGFKLGSGRKATPAQAAAYRAGLKSGSIAPPARPVLITYSAQYPPRPFMGPAWRAEIEAGHVASAWSGAVKSA